jgi:hypothetical protein
VRWANVFLLGAAALAATTTTARFAVAAPPLVEIKAQTQLSLGKVRLHDGDIAEVSGQLVDKLTGDGIANQRVTVRLGDATAEAITRADGTFSVDNVPINPGQVTVTLAYRGGNEIDPAQPLVVTTDPSRSAVELTIAKLDDTHAGAELVVRATVDGVGVRLPVDIAIGSGADDKVTPLIHVATGDNFVLARANVGGAGSHHIRASFPGDDSRQPATADATVELSTTSATSIELSTTELAYEDDLVITGKVTDDDGAPIGHAAVTLASGDRSLAQATTDELGGYRFKIEGEVLGTGQLGVQVRAEPQSTFVKASHSRPAVVRVAEPQPVPVSYTIVGFIATVVAAGGFFFARAKPWTKLRRRAPASSTTAEAGDGAAPSAGGLVANKPSIVSTLRRAADDGFSGVVRDTVRGRPVADAVVYLVLRDLEQEIRAESDGRFAIDGLIAGEWRAEVAAPGHVTEKFVVTIPHRGELRDVRVDLMPVREKVFQLYRRAAEPVLPESRLWGVWSPRQIVDHVRNKRPSPALAELTDFVEEIYFSPRLAAETVLPHASERVDRAIRERARGIAPPS